MAKATDESSTEIWLRDALALALAALGTRALAERQLRAWLASGELPWSCIKWTGFTAAELERELRRGNTLIRPRIAHDPGGQSFWAANIEVNWFDNFAYEIGFGGARAEGIRVPRKRLIALLPTIPLGTPVLPIEPASPPERPKSLLARWKQSSAEADQAAALRRLAEALEAHRPVQTGVAPDDSSSQPTTNPMPGDTPPSDAKPASEQAEVRGGARWIAIEASRMKKAGEIPLDKTNFARELARRMRKAADADRSIRPVGWPHIRNKLVDWGLWPITSIKLI